MQFRAMMFAMTMTQVPAVLEFGLGDRLRKSMQVAGKSVEEMAQLLLVNRNTVGSWINGRNRPRMSAVMVWADKTGYPLDWLIDGKLSCRVIADGDGWRQATPQEEWDLRVAEGSVRPEGFEPPAYWSVAQHDWMLAA